MVFPNRKLCSPSGKLIFEFPLGTFHIDTQIKLDTSEPIGSVEFRRFPCDRIPIQISSDEFRSVPMGSVDFQQIPGRNFAESTGTFPAETGLESCRKEIVGTQRSRPKMNGIYRIRCRKTKKTIGSDGWNSGPRIELTEKSLL